MIEQISNVAQREGREVRPPSVLGECKYCCLLHQVDGSIDGNSENSLRRGSESMDEHVRELLSHNSSRIVVINNVVGMFKHTSGRLRQPHTYAIAMTR